MYGIPLEHCNKADALDSLIGIAARAVACNFASFAPPPDDLPGATKAPSRNVPAKPAAVLPSAAAAQPTAVARPAAVASNFAGVAAPQSSLPGASFAFIPPPQDDLSGAGGHYLSWRALPAEAGRY